jgi:hypothetical protein
MNRVRPRRPSAPPYRLDQWLLAVAGVVAFSLGATYHKDRGNLAVTLVGLGVLLVVVAVILPRLQKLSGKIGGVELAVSLIPPLAVETDRGLATAAVDGLPPTDLRSAGVPASGPTGFAEAIKGGRADVVVINLENGRAWLTSRLFIFMSMLTALRGVEAVVFTHRPKGHDEVLGVATADAVIHGLASAYPWLPIALGEAWENLRRNTPGLAPDRRVSIGDADQLYSAFVRRVSSPEIPAPSPSGEWIRQQDRWERAAWIEPSLVRRILLNSLSEVSVMEQATMAAGLNREPPESAALAYIGVRFVPVVSDRREYRAVVDRYAVLDALWHQRSLMQ